MVDETISQERDRNISKTLLSFVVLDMMKVLYILQVKEDNTMVKKSR